MRIDWNDLKEAITDNFFEKVLFLVLLFFMLTGAYYWACKFYPYIVHFIKIIINYL